MRKSSRIKSGCMPVKASIVVKRICRMTGRTIRRASSGKRGGKNEPVS